MKCGGTIDGHNRIFCTGVGRKIGFEAINVGANRRNPPRVEAIFDVLPFIAFETWRMQRNRAVVGTYDFCNAIED